jgi:asparagine synthetase A
VRERRLPQWQGKSESGRSSGDESDSVFWEGVNGWVCGLSGMPIRVGAAIVDENVDRSMSRDRSGR